MNNSAEKYFKEWEKANILKYEFVQQLSTHDKTVRLRADDWMKFAEEYHAFAREKELSELTDEVIEGIVKPNVAYYTLAERIEGAKALRDFQKQNNLKK